MIDFTWDDPWRELGVYRIDGFITEQLGSLTRCQGLTGIGA